MNDINAALAMLGLPEITVWDLIAMTVLSLPPLFVVFSKRVSGGRKVLWFILTSLFSWLAYVPFLWLTRKKGDGTPPAQPAR